MKKYKPTCLIIILCIMFFGLVEKSNAIELELVADPPNTTIQVGSIPIALTAEAQGTDLKFQWLLVGAGSFEGDNTQQAVLYVPPTDISGDSSRALISIKVTDYKGTEATKSLSFTIVKSTDSSPSPSKPSQRPVSEPSDDLELIFYENFEKGLKDWRKYGSTIQIVQGEQQGKYIKISRKDSKAKTYIHQDFTGYSGTLIFEAMIKSDNIVPGEFYYCRGKFLAQVDFKNGDTTWHDDDFEGTINEWTSRRFEVNDLEGTETVILTIGLQEAKGIVYVDEVKVYHEP